MTKNLISGLILARLAPVRAPDSFVGFTSSICWILSQAIIVCNFKGNLWSKLKEMAKPSLTLLEKCPNTVLFLLRTQSKHRKIRYRNNFVFGHFSRSVWVWFRPAGFKFEPPLFFSKTWLRQSLNIMVSYHVRYQKKLMIQSWENLVTGGRTDGRTDEQTGGRDWFHRKLSD